MRVAFPIFDDKGMESTVYGHFGSAPRFIIMDTQTGDFESAGNQNLDHTHGNCQPMVALGGRTVDAVVVGGIGRGALMKLQNSGITTFRAIEGTVSENLTLLNNGKLPRFTPELTCSGNHSNGTCAH